MAVVEFGEFSRPDLLFDEVLVSGDEFADLLVGGSDTGADLLIRLEVEPLAHFAATFYPSLARSAHWSGQKRVGTEQIQL